MALKYQGATPGPNVQLTTIDELVSDLKLERVDYIKMDIEGAERAALVGATGTIRRFHPRLTISMEHRYDDPKTIPKMVLSLWSGYRMACGRCIEQSAGLRPAVDELLRGAVAATFAPSAWSAAGRRGCRACPAPPARGRPRG